MHSYIFKYMWIHMDLYIYVFIYIDTSAHAAVRKWSHVIRHNCLQNTNSYKVTANFMYHHIYMYIYIRTCINIYINV